MKKCMILGCLVVVMSLTACDKYLDLVPKGESVLNTTDDYLGLIEAIDAAYPMEVYWYLSGETSYYKKDELESYKYPLNSIAFFWDEETDRYKYTVTDGLYSKCYARIAKYNVIVSNIKDAEGPEADKILGLAQGKVMRAYNYFMLVNTFAKPYNKETAAEDNGIIIHEELNLESKSKQYTVEEVYRFIEKDLNEAIPDLPDRALNEFRPSRSFGYALRAKVYLFMGEIDLALADALEALKSDFHKLWDMNDMYNSVLTQFPMISMMPSMWAQFAANPRSNPENLLYQFSLSDLEPSPTYIRQPWINLYDTKADLRYITCLGYYMPPRATAETGAVQFMSSQVKWNCGGMRLSEVYLMIAECYARKNDKDNALKYLNDLRKNRMLKGMYEDLEAADATIALNLVRDERKRELVFTCNGFFDVRRFCTQLNETLTKEYVTTEGETRILTLKPDSPLLVFPFPQNAMETSDLIQNTK